MAKAKEIQINSRLRTDELKKDVEVATAELNKVRNAAELKDPRGRGGIESTTKKWGQFSNLFSTVLPRDIQMTIRRFQGKRREVARATQGMTAFNKVMKGFGGPILAAVIIGLEKLIEYLPKIIDYFTGNTDAVKALTAANEAAMQTMDRYIGQNQAYFDILVDTNQALETRLAAQEYLSRSISGLRDINLEAADALERLNEEYTKQAERQANEAAMNELQEQYIVYLKEREELETKLEKLETQNFKYKSDRETYERIYLEDLAELESEYAELLQNRVDLSEQIIEQQRELAQQALEQKTAEQERQRVMKLNKTLYDMEREMRLERLDEYDREIEKIDEKERAQIREATEANASQEEMTTIYRYYSAQRQEIRDKEAAAQEAEAKRLKDERERELEETINLQNRIEEVLFGDAETRALAAVESRYDALIKAAKDANMDITELEKKRDEELAKTSEEFIQRQEEESQRLADQEYKRESDRLAMLAKMYQWNAEELYQIQLEQLDREYKEALEHAERLGVDVNAVHAYYAKKREELEGNTTEAIDKQRQESMDTFRQGMGDLFDGIMGLMDRNSKNAKRLAVIEVLINQAQALAKGISAAVEATPKTPAYPFQLAGYIATIAGTILSGFAQVKAIMNQAGASGGGGSMTARMPTQALIPSVSSQTQEAKSMNVSAYVVQSDLQGSNLMWENMGKRITL